MKNKKHFLDTTHPRACFKRGDRVEQEMGIRRKGTVILSRELPMEEITRETRRAYPAQPYVPVKWDNGEAFATARQHIKKIPALSPQSA